MVRGLAAAWAEVIEAELHRSLNIKNPAFTLMIIIPPDLN